jgi:imidazolonepropionase-like amidohydrolase
MSLSILGAAGQSLVSEDIPSTPNVYLSGCRILDGTGALPISGCSIWIEDGVIRSLGVEADAMASQRPHAGLACPGLTVLPGLIDAHVHLVFDGAPASQGMRAYVAEWERNSDADLLIQAAAAAQRTVAAGVTTVRDCGDRNNLTLGLRDAIACGRIPGPRIVACGMPITTTAGHCHYLGLRADGVNAVRCAVRGQIEAGVDAIKVMLTGGGMTPGSNPTRTQYSQSEARILVDEAHRLGKRVAAHIHAAEGMALAAEVGCDSLEHCNWLTPDGTGFDPGVVDTLATAGQFAGINFPGHDHLLLRPRDAYTPELEALRSRRETRFEWIRRMIGTGMPYMVTTDAGAAGTRHGSLPLAAQGLVDLVGLSPMDAIQAITSSPARALGIEEEVGTIAVGKRADLTVVHGDPVQDIRALRDVAYVIKDGRLAVEGGKLVV